MSEQIRGSVVRSKAGRRRRRNILLVALAVAVAAVAAATAGILVARGDAQTTATPTRSPASVSSPTVDAAGQQACQLAKAAYDDDRLMVPDAVAAIVRAAADAASGDVRFDAQMLHDRQALALGNDDPVYELDLQTAAINMQAHCVTAGLLR